METDPWLVREILDAAADRPAESSDQFVASTLDGISWTMHPDIVSSTRTAAASAEWINLLRRAHAERESKLNHDSGGRSAKASIELLEVLKQAKKEKEKVGKKLRSSARWRSLQPVSVSSQDRSLRDCRSRRASHATVSGHVGLKRGRACGTWEAALSRGDLIMSRVDGTVLGDVIDRTWVVREIKKLSGSRIIDVKMGEDGRSYTHHPELVISDIRDSYLTVVNIAAEGTVQLLFPFSFPACIRPLVY